MKMNNITVTVNKNKKNPKLERSLHEFEPRNTFEDSTAGCNISDYRELMGNKAAGNSTVQWIVQLRSKL